MTIAVLSSKAWMPRKSSFEEQQARGQDRRRKQLQIEVVFLL
jgi:hypothetical protein